MVRTVFLIYILFVTWSVHAEEDQECTIKAELAMKSVGEMVKKIEPVHLTKIPPTKLVKVYGVSGIELQPGKEVQTFRNETTTTSKFFVNIPEGRLDLYIELPKNPAKIPTIVQKAFTDVATDDCPPEKRHVVSKVIAGAQIKPPGLSDMLGLTECRPPIPSIGGGIGIGGKGVSAGGSNAKQGDGKCNDEYVSGIIRVIKPNVRVEVVTSVGSDKKVRIESANILNSGYENVKSTCHSSCAGFEDACKCFVATKLPVQIIITVFNLVLPCACDEESQKHQSLAHHFYCDN